MFCLTILLTSKSYKVKPPQRERANVDVGAVDHLPHRKRKKYIKLGPIMNKIRYSTVQGENFRKYFEVLM